jgi:hypothetical protein
MPTGMVAGKPLTRDQAKSLLCECLRAGTVVFSRHFREELANDGLTVADILPVCRGGVVKDAPEPDIKRGTWKYRIEGRTPDRDLAAVVFSFDVERRAVFITAFKKTNG